MATMKKSTKKVLGRALGWGIATLPEGSKQYQLVEAYFSRTDARDAKRSEYNAPNFKLVRISSTFTGYNK